MSYDTNVPARLVHIQHWFGKVITQSMGSKIEFVNTYIAETKELRAEERMNLYNQSYWLRLLAALHEEYPFVSRLFGKEAFDAEIGTEFLTAHPPTHWNLNLLGKNLVNFLKINYTACDRLLVLKAAEIDWACQQSFFAITKPEINPANYIGEEATNLLNVPLQLQPHVQLIEAAGHFMRYRKEFLQQDHDYWLLHDFPVLEKDKVYYFIIFRDSELNIQWHELDPLDYSLLALIKTGHTIDQALDKVDECDKIPQWIAKWLNQKWICLSLQP